MRLTEVILSLSMETLAKIKQYIDNENPMIGLNAINFSKGEIEVSRIRINAVSDAKKLRINYDCRFSEKEFLRSKAKEMWTLLRAYFGSRSRFLIC